MSGNEQQQQQWERQQYFNNNYGPPQQQQQHQPPQRNEYQSPEVQDDPRGVFAVFSDGFGNFLRVYPNQKYEMFTPPSQNSFHSPTGQESIYTGDRYPQSPPQQRDSQGNFFINQLVGNWTPGTDLRGQQQVPVQQDLLPPPQPPVLSKPVHQKPRAEVKPILLYSDVLSKNVPPAASQPATTNGFQTSQGIPPSSKKEGSKKQSGTEKKFEGEKFRKREKKEVPVQKEPMMKPEAPKDAEKNKKKQKDGKKETKVKNKQPKTSPSFSKLGDDFEIEADDEPAEIYETFYNVRKTENYEKAKASSHKKKPLTTTVTKASSKQEKQATSYKRQKGRKSQRILMLEKIWSVWLEYILKFVSWLWSLISDVVWLSYGLAYDRFYSAFLYIKQAYQCCRKELGNNTNRPSVWLKGLWTRFDARFDKDSRWAIWRRSLWRSKDTAPTESKDSYKNGRLPSTADEAMHNLLNCKGKDAYSILGVEPDCSQEQIRKHYKKIAVLVHPDKNKQPGAEEAFKVLQRSFELIGEPENRQNYDQNTAEALNTEKAFSELNDLLKQLHTKISEAANTIRCSSCSSRHPRKPTGRPPYAARECNSCRIRHSAREGDIWAETTFFGLKWKYMALMEGNVYDITEWANCQKGALSHLQPNSHVVQYRIVLGQNNQQAADKEKRKEPSSSEPTMDDILSNIYSGQNQQPGSNTRRRKNK